MNILEKYLPRLIEEHCFKKDGEIFIKEAVLNDLIRKNEFNKTQIAIFKKLLKDNRYYN